MRRTLAQRTMLVTGIVMPVLGLAACSLLVDVDGLAGPAPPSDAGFDVAALPADVSADAPADAVVVDAVPDAVADGGCQGTFCEDFDTRPIGEGWSTTTITAGASLDRAEGRSKPYALRARTFAVGGGQAKEAIAMLSQKLPAGSGINCSFGVFVVKAHGWFADLFAIRTTTFGRFYELRFGTDTVDAGTLRDDFALQDGGCECPYQEYSPLPLPPGKWVQVNIDYTFKRVTLRYDGQIIRSVDFDVAHPAPTDAITVDLGVAGYPRSNASAQEQASEYLFDDLVCTVTP